MHRLSPLVPVLAALALAAACAPDDTGGDEVQDTAVEQGVEVEEYVPPVLTPAESAAAVTAIKAHGDSMTQAVMGPDYKPPTEVYVDTPEKQYASCMAQANSVDEPTRSTILKACERFRNPPPQK